MPVLADDDDGIRRSLEQTAELLFTRCTLRIDAVKLGDAILLANSRPQRATLSRSDCCRDSLGDEPLRKIPHWF